MWSATVDGELGAVPAGDHMIGGAFGITDFTRMLAKIAHAETFGFLLSGDDARFGTVEEWELLLPEYILTAKAGDGAYLVGGTAALRPHEAGVIHERRWRVERRPEADYLVCDLRLWAGYGGPDYHVVFGRRWRAGQFWLASPFQR